ncbi:wlm domain-containing protein [Ophiostoma piceae UAMH 11346]|uniref:Wlm domain-containing protein n=1 Tax=Ophiostoma piceae (strain UAMH 11346) TaxID=1262450 RepID=S3CEP3_OPHP1|nr:wlm domain-containing protein [Ophiostoma piceae UAMH 11346]
MPPNPHIVFIKPLKGPDENVSRQFLERIAAQCVPVMRNNHISVMTLEEYEPNAEFVGRNFNAGEVIQLVLKTRGPRRERQWLPFSYVQMVMMHELAHCKQMNHSRAFWAVRNTYAAEMRQLWSSRYTGEGIWGRGAVLGTAGGTPLYERNVVADDDEALLVEHLCGGTYRSRGRKRKGKGKEQLTYREREDRRVKRKFGVNGVALGDDLEERAKLEAPKAPSSLSLSQTTLAPIKSETKPPESRAKVSKTEQKRLATKPRVAVSKRGRELRAAAALARFGQAKQEEAEEKKPTAVKDEDRDELDDLLAIKREDNGAAVDFLSDDDGYEDDDQAGPDAVDIDGTRLVDEQGRSMVRVCEGMGDGGAGSDNDGDSAGDARRELRELMQSSGWAPKNEPDRSRNAELYDIPAWVEPDRPDPGPSEPPKPEPERLPKPQPDQAAGPKSAPRVVVAQHVKTERVKTEPAQTAPAAPAASGHVKDERPASSLREIPAFNEPAASTNNSDCGVCSYANDVQAITCAVCGHVLHPDIIPDAWHCESAPCRPAEGAVRYLNSGDCGVCGVCGQRRP